MSYSSCESYYFPSTVLKKKLKPFFLVLKEFTETTEDPNISDLLPTFLEVYLLECVMDFGGDITTYNYKAIIEDLIDNLDDLIDYCYYIDSFRRDDEGKLILRGFPSEEIESLLGYNKLQDEEDNLC